MRRDHYRQWSNDPPGIVRNAVPLWGSIFRTQTAELTLIAQPIRESLLPRAGGHHKSPDQRDVDVCFRKCCEAWTWHQSFIGVVKSKHSFGRVPLGWRHDRLIQSHCDLHRAFGDVRLALRKWPSMLASEGAHSLGKGKMRHIYEVVGGALCSRLT